MTATTEIKTYEERCRSAMAQLGTITNINQIMKFCDDTNRKPYRLAVIELLKKGEWVKVNNKYLCTQKGKQFCETFKFQSGKQNLELINKVKKGEDILDIESQIGNAMAQDFIDGKNDQFVLWVLKLVLFDLVKSKGSVETKRIVNDILSKIEN